MSSINTTAFRCPDCEVRPGEDHLPNCSVPRPTLTHEERHFLAREAAKGPSPLTVFDGEIATITQRRGDVYGHPTDDFNTAADLMAHFDRIEPPALRHALRMVCVKLARIKTTPDHLDSYVDIVGYARCAVMVIDRAEREKQESENSR